MKSISPGGSLLQAAEEYPLELARLRDRLRPLRPSAVFAPNDMTKTHLFQEPYHFPPSHRENIRSFIRQGGMFCIVSGDDIQVIHELFIAPLGNIGGDAGNDRYYAISSGGFQIDVIQEAQPRCIWQGDPVDDEIRRAVLAHALQCIRQVIALPDFDFSPSDTSRLFSPQGDRVDISARASLEVTFWCEVRPGKVTLYAPGSEPTCKSARILDLFAAQPEVVRRAQSQGLTVVRGADFVDVGKTKLDGMQKFAELCQSSHPDISPAHRNLQARHIVPIGDGPNDLGIYRWTHGFQSSKGSTPLFVGDSDDFLDVIRNEGSRQAIYIKGGFIDGTSLAFRHLVA